MKSLFVFVMILAFQDAAFPQWPNGHNRKSFITDLMVAEFQTPYRVRSYPDIRSVNVDWEHWVEQCEGMITRKETLQSIYGSPCVSASCSGSGITYIDRDRQLKHFKPDEDLGVRIEFVVEETSRGNEANLKFWASAVGATQLGAITIAGTSVPFGKPSVEVIEREWSFAIEDNCVYVLEFSGADGKRMQIALHSTTKHRQDTTTSHQVAADKPPGEPFIAMSLPYPTGLVTDSR